MDGVGARLGRSSTRFAPTTVFTGPVRRWKKKWIHGTPPSSGNNHRQTTAANAGSNLLLFKWTPISSESQNTTDSSAKDEVEEPPKRKFKYIPINVLEEQKNDPSEQADSETKPIDADTDGEGTTYLAGGFDGKPDINDVAMEESQKEPLERQDLNESTLDLSFD